MRSLAHDLRQAARSLLRAPYVTIVSILSIGLGVGASVAVYSWMDGLVLHPFPAVPDQGRLVGIEVGEPNGGMGAWSYQTFKELQSGLNSFTGLAAWNIIRVSVRSPGEAASVPLLATNISGRYLEVLGMRPVLGRAIIETDVQSATPVAMLSYRYWADRFAGDPAVLGRTLLLNGEAVTIVGVLPPFFSGVYTGVAPQLYVPLTLQPRLTGTDLLSDRKVRRWLLIARLAPDVSREQAQREADGVAKRISAGYGDRPAPGATVMFLRVQFLGATLSPLLSAMLAVTALLLVLAAANVASLLLVRSSARGHEVAVHCALGAPRVRILQRVICESALLAVAGSALGIGAAYLARGALYSFVPLGPFPLSLPVPLSWRVLGAASAATLAVAVACGIAPALAAMRTAPVLALRAGGRGLSAGGARLRSAIVSGQLAFCVLFLVLAGMFIRGLQSASAVDRGFSDPEHVLLVSTNFAAARLTDTAGTTAVARLLTRLRALPGVSDASVATMVPLGFGGADVPEMKINGYAPAPGEDMTANRSFIGSGYAATMRIPIIRGREFLETDRARAPAVAVVNETFAKRFFGGDAIGRRIDAGRGWATVVGVFHDGKYGTLDEKPLALVYLPIAQNFQPSMTIHVRTPGDPKMLTEAVRRALQSVHVDLPALQPRTLAEHISAATFVQRTGASVLSAFALAALLLSIVGLYGALAFAVALRSRELAIRLALGAAQRTVLWVVVRHALVIAGSGLLIGGAMSIAGGELLRAGIARMGAADPVTYASAAALLLLAAALSAWIPARRATRLDPADALRSE